MTLIIFDLDGTLIDTTQLVFPAFRETLRHFPDAAQPGDDVLSQTFGMPDGQIWRTLLPNVPESRQREAFEMAEQMIQRGMHGSQSLMPGAHQVLSTLRARGYTLTVASNCGNAYLAAVLDSQGLRDYFDRPLCLESVHGQCKADILTEHFRHFPKELAVMVGDRQSDIEAADSHGIPAIGCQFGFGNEAELVGADVCIDRLEALLPLFPGDGSALLFPHGRG